MSESILTSVKKMLGLAEDYKAFDTDIIIHINSVFETLHDLGIGPAEGFEIQDASTTWDAYLVGTPRYNSVKTYMYLRVRLLFDPPTTSYAIAAFKEEVQQLEWRLNVNRESTDWVDPDPDVVTDDLIVIDLGDPYGP